MKNLLREKRLAKYIDDDMTDSMDGYIKEEDKQVLAEIQFTMDNAQIKLIMHSEMAREAWVKLRDRHLFTVTVNKVVLQAQFLGMKKGNESVKDYHMKVNEMAEHLISLGIMVSEEERTIVLMNSLPEAYDAVIEILHQTN